MGTRTVAFELTPGQKRQRDLAASASRHILAYGGARSSKTFGFCYFIATRALMAPGSRHGIFRLHNIDAKQSVMMDTWPKMMSLAYPDVPQKVNKSDQMIEIGDGAEVWFAGLDDKERVEKVLGKEYATIYTGECSQISFASIKVLRTRLAQSVAKVNGEPLPLKAYYDLNPVGKRHWTYVDLVQGLQPETLQPYPAGTRAWIKMDPKDNPHLPQDFLDELATLPERDRKRFLEGEYQSDVPGAIWTSDALDEGRRTSPPELRRVVVGVDPSGGDGSGNDSQGIVVAGKGIDGHAYVLEDATCSMSPAGWARRAVEAYDRWGADCLVAEVNYGGAMVESTVRSVGPHVKYKQVTASRGKHVRAEPVAALYESHEQRECRVHHVGAFPDLEDQLCSFTTSGFEGAGSPDRADALVWALTELMLGEEKTQFGLLAKKRHRAKEAA